jgi:hypothetical protein
MQKKKRESTLEMGNGLSKIEEVNSGIRMGNGIEEIENGTKSTETKK